MLVSYLNDPLLGTREVLSMYTMVLVGEMMAEVILMICQF